MSARTTKQSKDVILAGMQARVRFSHFWNAGEEFREANDDAALVAALRECLAAAGIEQLTPTMPGQLHQSTIQESDSARRIG